MSIKWGIVATVKATPVAVSKFVKYHSTLGGDIFIYFDDPNDESFKDICGLPNVTAIKCDDTHWSSIGGRPDKHQRRQGFNARHAYATCNLDWIAHIDVDEFILPESDVLSALSSVSQNTMTVKMEPFEEVSATDDLKEAVGYRLFRKNLKTLTDTEKMCILGTFSKLLPDGMLSHTQGKRFFRCGVDGMHIKIHGATVHGRAVGGQFTSDLKLLHSHAHDYNNWLELLNRRTASGAYIKKNDLRDFLTGANLEQIHSFYTETQIINGKKAELLAIRGMIAMVEDELLNPQ